MIKSIKFASAQHSNGKGAILLSTYFSDRIKKFERLICSVKISVIESQMMSLETRRY